MEPLKHSFEEVLAKCSRAPLDHQSLWRSIPTAFPTKILYYADQLDKDEIEFAGALADGTSAIEHQSNSKDRWYDYGDNEHLEFCFNEVNIPSSRFTDGGFPVWYGADSQEASKAEVMHHLARQAQVELKGTKEENAIEFQRVFCQAHVNLKMSLDLREYAKILHQGVLESGPPYPFCNKIAEVSFQRGDEGIITLSRRYKNAECWAVFKRDAIVQSRAKAYWSVTIDRDGYIYGMGGVRIEYQDGWMRELF